MTKNVYEVKLNTEAKGAEGVKIALQVESMGDDIDALVLSYFERDTRNGGLEVMTPTYNVDGYLSTLWLAGDWTGEGPEECKACMFFVASVSRLSDN